MEVTEGGVTLEVPGETTDGIGEGVFYNPRMELNRDVTVATLRAFRERDPGTTTYLDAMTASGVRGVRAAGEGFSVTLADVDPDAVDLARRNLAGAGLDGEVLHRDANALLHERGRGRGEAFDVVDVDPFGTPIPFADGAFANARRLVCVTATDTAPLCGAHMRSGVRKYAAVPRNTEYHAEMGLRVLLSALVRTAARYDVGATPLLSHVSDHYVRTYLALDAGAGPADAAIDQLGYVHHCPECLHREYARGLIAHPPEACPNCGGGNAVTAGPLWLGSAHDPAFVARVRDAVDDGMGTARRARRVLDRVAGELDVPTHFDQHRLTKRWGVSAPPMEEFLDRLREAGFETTRTHYGGTTFKTTADVADVESVFVG